MNKHILEPKLIENNIMWYEARFPSLIALYNYLNSKPYVNEDVFTSRESQSVEDDFHGKPLDVAINYLKGGYNKDFKEFLQLKRNLDSKIEIIPFASEFESTAVGSRINIPNALAGHPKFMLKPKNTRELKFVNIYYNLGYPGMTDDYEIRNRGLIVLNLIKLLENNDYRVNLNTFKILKIDNEYCYISITLKEHGSLLNVSECYYPFVAKEFSRRVLFYFIETMPLRNYGWGRTYGKHLELNEIREKLKLTSDDILIGYPSQMGITDDLEESVKNCFEEIDLDKYIKIKKL